MNIERAQKRIILFVIVPAALAYIGLRFYAQWRHVDLYVSRAAPMPAELASGLHMQEHKIEPTIRIESPYDSAPDKILPPEEIRRLRRALAWGSSLPAFVDSLTIVSPTNALARRNTKTTMLEYWLVQRDGEWKIQSETRRRIKRYPAP